MSHGKMPPVATAAISAGEAIQKAKISVVWLVPVVAVFVAAYLVYDRVKNSGPEVSVTFRNGDGLQAGQTLLRYRGVKVGDVRSVALTRDGERVAVEVRLDKSAAHLARQGSVFWVVRPEVGIGGLRALETIVSGAYIQVEPGTGPEEKKFVGSEETPAVKTSDGELEIVVTSPQIGTLDVGAPVYYRGLEVGAVETLDLSKDATTVNVHLQIQRRYASLVREDSKFWNAGGLSVSLKLFGINVSAESVKSLVVGGIAFATPSPPGAPAAAKSVFTLNEKPEEKWLKWAPQISDGGATNQAAGQVFASERRP